MFNWFKNYLSKRKEKYDAETLKAWRAELKGNTRASVIKDGKPLQGKVSYFHPALGYVFVPDDQKPLPSHFRAEEIFPAASSSEL